MEGAPLKMRGCLLFLLLALERPGDPDRFTLSYPRNKLEYDKVEGYYHIRPHASTLQTTLHFKAGRDPTIPASMTIKIAKNYE